MIIIQGELIGRLSQEFGEQRWIIVGSLLTATGLPFVPPAAHTRLGAFIACLTLVPIGNPINNPSLLILVSKFAFRTNGARPWGFIKALEARRESWDHSQPAGSPTMWERECPSRLQE